MTLPFNCQEEKAAVAKSNSSSSSSEADAKDGEVQGDKYVPTTIPPSPKKAAAKPTPRTPEDDRLAKQAKALRSPLKVPSKKSFSSWQHDDSPDTDEDVAKAKDVLPASSSTAMRVQSWPGIAAA